MTPAEALAAGRVILDEVLIPAGFEYIIGPSGCGSGGDYAAATYARGDRRLTLSYRYALGDVRYAIGGDELEHNVYMRLLGHYGASRFASFSRDEPLAGFHALRRDLESFCGDFLRGDGVEFQQLAAKLRAYPDGQLPPLRP